MGLESRIEQLEKKVGAVQSGQKPSLGVPAWMVEMTERELEVEMRNVLGLAGYDQRAIDEIIEYPLESAFDEDFQSLLESLE